MSVVLGGGGAGLQWCAYRGQRRALGRQFSPSMIRRWSSGCQALTASGFAPQPSISQAPNFQSPFCQLSFFLWCWGLNLEPFPFQANTIPLRYPQLSTRNVKHCFYVGNINSVYSMQISKTQAEQFSNKRILTQLQRII